MVDYTRDIGGNTTMMIRDTGGNVEFWVRTGSSTWNNDQRWSFRANNAESGTRSFRLLRGGQWQKFGETYVGYDQDIRFTLFGSGLGFPTYDFWQHIQRSTVPGAPNLHTYYGISTTQIRVAFDDGYNGGSPILEKQIGYGGNPNGPEFYVASNGATDIGGFSKGQRVFFWARTRNAIGIGPWSNRGEASTWREPDPPNPVEFSDVTQTSLRTFFQGGWDGGIAVEERQLGYGKSPDAPENFAGEISGQNILENLDPGRTYYFWGRTRNPVGWSPWSPRSEVSLIAGAIVLSGDIWRRAVPYVRVAGTWKVARPWVKDSGTWKESSR